MSPTRPVILDAYAAIRCPVKVHNYHDRTVRLPDGIDAFAMRGSSDLQQELFGGRAFVDHVLELLVARPDAVDLRPLAEEDWTSSFFGLSGFVDFMDVLFIIIIIAITIARILTFDMPTKIIRNAIDTICK